MALALSSTKNSPAPWTKLAGLAQSTAREGFWSRRCPAISEPTLRKTFEKQPHRNLRAKKNEELYRRLA